MAGTEENNQLSAEYNALMEMTEDLCNALPITDLLPKMISKRVISFQDKDEIRSERTDRDKVQLFLSKLAGEMASGENERFYRFTNVMKESPKCNFLVKRMEGRISQQMSQSRSPTNGGSFPQHSPSASTGKVIGHSEMYFFMIIISSNCKDSTQFTDACICILTHLS